MAAIYALVPVIADVIDSHCGGRARETFVSACVNGHRDEAEAMIEGMLAGTLAEGADAPSPTATLAALAARSLVGLAAEPGVGSTPTPRVRLHPLLRKYAGERYAAGIPA